MMKDVFSLEGRTALVTGGSRGIGRMIAQGFLEQGAKVYISARKADKAAQTAKELSAFGPCEALAFDVASTDGAKALAAAYGAKESHLDILVHNAGAAWGASFREFPEAGWDKVVDLNMKAPFFLTQALYSALTKRASKERPSKVVIIASVDGFFVNPVESYSYHASKAGVLHLTKKMAMHLIKDHVVVSAIAPGAFATDMNKTARDNPEYYDDHIPAGRIGRPEDIASAATFLASRAGDYVVGTTVTVDGGVSWGY
ncbi:MAG: SDR family oxidoreductase [Hyphomicrobiales bacterium]|nr:SDR family oxidoreductase [Hyphomicrobiales bacterium]